MENQLIELQSKTFELNRTTSKIDLKYLLEESAERYINEKRLFATYFNTIPNIIGETNINCKKANEWFISHYKKEIKNVYYNKRHLRRKKEYSFDSIFYILEKDLLIHFDSNIGYVSFLFRETDITKINAIIKGINKFSTLIRNNYYISLLHYTPHGIETKPLQITRPKLSIAENYNDDFAEIHTTILNRLSKKNDKGLVLLQGKPGTGKTSYIRYLITKIKKQVVFLPPNMAGSITNPNLMNVLIDNPNSVFVIEDAENIIADREKDGQSPVSVLLNIADGLLSDCLNIQIICSFNTDISKIDSALMRRGRLIAKYEFKELEIEKAQQLSLKLGFPGIFNKPMTLTEIYNQKEKDFMEVKSKKVIGFEMMSAG